MAVLNQTWNLDVFFPGGSESPQFEAYLIALQGEIAAFGQQVAQTPAPLTLGQVEPFAALFETVQRTGARLQQARAFTSCLTAQDVKDEKAKILAARIGQIGAGFGNAFTVLEKKLLAIPEEIWTALLADDRLSPIQFQLQERRRQAAEKLPAEQEALINDLAVDGYHSWGRLRASLAGRMTVPFEENGKTVQISVPQAGNRMQTADREARKTLFGRVQEAWAKEAELIAAAMNHLGGFRLALYKHRGWESILKEPLENNRMTEQTLTAMWDVIEAHKEHLLAYLNRKARLVGVEKLEWQDYNAPIGNDARKWGYDEAADFILDHFGRFSPHMAEFARQAFDERWIEVEDRSTKAGGGFCTTFIESKQSRIFMTFAGNAHNVRTLAHELGHAYHNVVLRDLPLMARQYSMNVAETASTFCEMMIADATVQQARTVDEKIALLDDKIGTALLYFIHIHSRFLFELSFYEERKRGPVSVKRLCELVEAAQRKAYRESLATYNPYFWASNSHLYMTGAPFYNWPYTFGYLFSQGIYARAKAEGPTFAEKYVALLRDTGRMRVEDLALRHLNADLTGPTFWQEAMQVTVADVQEFLRLTEGRLA